MKNMARGGAEEGQRTGGGPAVVRALDQAPDQREQRAVQRLQQAGYADRVPDPDDRRAPLIQLTPSGRAASGRIREAGTSSMQAALAHWSPQERHQLAAAAPHGR
jgi:hypothetical protein